MDPTFFVSGLAAREMHEQLAELERERQLRQWYGHRRTPRRRFSFSLLRRRRPAAREVCSEQSATETC
jgi:hypothetical protein